MTDNIAHCTRFRLDGQGEDSNKSGKNTLWKKKFPQNGRKNEITGTGGGLTKPVYGGFQQDDQPYATSYTASFSGAGREKQKVTPSGTSNHKK